MSENNKASTSGGVGFCGLLTISFVVLKLIGVIDWSWVWVLSPIWMPIVIIVVILIIIFIVCKIANK